MSVVVTGKLIITVEAECRSCGRTLKMTSEIDSCLLKTGIMQLIPHRYDELVGLIRADALRRGWETFESKRNMCGRCKDPA